MCGGRLRGRSSEREKQSVWNNHDRSTAGKTSKLNRLEVFFHVSYFIFNQFIISSEWRKFDRYNKSVSTNLVLKHKTVSHSSTNRNTDSVQQCWADSTRHHERVHVWYRAGVFLPVSMMMGHVLMLTEAAASLDLRILVRIWVVRMHAALLTCKRRNKHLSTPLQLAVPFRQTPFCS